jgi:hypothetical protein
VPPEKLGTLLQSTQPGTSILLFVLFKLSFLLFLAAF